MMRVEVLNGVERRRRWSRDEKMRIIAESFESAARVVDVARGNDISPSLLFSWRRQVRQQVEPSPSMVPVVIAEPSVATELVATKPRRTRGRSKEHGLIEIDLGGSRRVRVGADVDADALARVLDVLSRR